VSACDQWLALENAVWQHADVVLACSSDAVDDDSGEVRSLVADEGSEKRDVCLIARPDVFSSASGNDSCPLDSSVPPVDEAVQRAEAPYGEEEVSHDSAVSLEVLISMCVPCEEVMCSVCGVVLPHDETVRATCCECWFRGCLPSVLEGCEDHLGRSAVLNEATPAGSARDSCQVADWVLPDDEIAFGSLVFPRMSFVENSVSEQEQSSEDVQQDASVTGMVSPDLGGTLVGTNMSEFEQTDQVREVLEVDSSPAASESLLRAQHVAAER
jgi:hypothetical protein